MPVLDARRYSHSYGGSSSGSFDPGAIGAIVVGAMVVIFIITYITQYIKGALSLPYFGP